MANVQVNIQYIPNAQGGENLVHEEYKFRVKNRKAERVYWRCCIKGCPATLNTHQGFITKYSRNHNHVANPHKVAVDKFLVAMKTKVQEETKPVCAIYQEEVSALRSDRDSGEMIREIPTFYSCCASLYRARAKILPALPQTRNDIQLPDSYTKTTSGDDFLLHAAADNRFLVFSTQENLYHLANADTIYCDGTFSMSPTLFTQIYTIHAFVHNKMFPLVYALLPDKKEATYVEFLRCVRDKTLALVNVNLNPGHVFTDFEVSMRNAVRTVLPRSELKGCFFHFGQCIWRNAQKYGLQADFSRVPEINKIAKQAAALPLIPIQQVEDVWLHALDARVLQFADYVTEFWVEGQHGRMMWNHFHTEGPRTTNHVEGWHSKITSIIATPHPNVFKLVAFFKNEQAYSEVTILQLGANGKLRPKRRKYRQLETRLQTLKTDLQNGIKTVFEYADGVARLTTL